MVSLITKMIFKNIIKYFLSKLIKNIEKWERLKRTTMFFHEKYVCSLTLHTRKLKLKNYNKYYKIREKN